jgi:hypothetical protein
VAIPFTTPPPQQKFNNNPALRKVGTETLNKKVISETVNLVT